MAAGVENFKLVFEDCISLGNYA